MKFYYSVTNPSKRIADLYKFPLSIGEKIKDAKYSRFEMLLWLGQHAGVRNVMDMTLDVCLYGQWDLPHPALVYVDLPFDFLQLKNDYHGLLHVTDRDIEFVSRLQPFFNPEAETPEALIPEPIYTAVQLPATRLYARAHVNTESHTYIRFEGEGTGEKLEFV